MPSRACPSCTSTMRPFQAGKVELDLCGFCRGIWFDAGELEHVLKKKLVGQLDTSQDSSRRCPADKVPLHAAVLHNLRVEVCTTCHGVFLDDGELVALNDGQKITVQAAQKPPRSEQQTKDDVMGWLDSLGA
ncbi:MAG TPA: zf-TFIIB domain-containing protein [Archangium sp.]